jgi:A/G-specific adenine glycosylase
MKPNPSRNKKLHRSILRWYRKSARDFHWRSTTDPYAILVSEIMLQQTQASRVKEKLPEFLKRFPRWDSLARATKADVVKAWRGMGYNSRAVRLWETANIVMREHGGTLPSDIAMLRRLPGIGPYTSSAVASFAFRQHVPVVDVNIRRVLTRLFHRTGSTNEKAIWELAKTILPADSYAWNQALMDLGATICKSRNPSCTECPVMRLCPSRNTSKNRSAFIDRKKPNLHAEPAYDGIPRRVWRGKIIEALRDAPPNRWLHILKLGKAIKKNFHNRETAWLAHLTSRLEKDRLVRRRVAGSAISVKLALE